MTKKIVIIGGGVAGLAAANALADFGIYATLIEGGTYPSHKVCGEFFSSESFPILQKWGFNSEANISKMKLITDSSSIMLPIQLRAFTCSRWKFDTALADRALSKGTELITNTRVEDLSIPENNHSAYELKLSDGRVIKANILIIGTGRLLAKLQEKRLPRLKYLGFKAHFNGIDCKDILEMYLVDNGYVGLAAIEDGKTNITGLIRLNKNQQSIEDIIAQNPILESRLVNSTMDFTEWITVKAPDFGRNPLPSWPHAYCVGDALGTLFPATGSGLTMGLISGYYAAQFIKRDDLDGYVRFINKSVGKAFLWAIVLHKIFLIETGKSYAIKALSHLPTFAEFMYRSTRIGNRR